MNLFRIALITCILLVSLSQEKSVFAYTYTPAPQISMTGSNADIVFGVRGEIFNEGTDALAPYLDTTDSKFYGSFYLPSIGWGLLQTGTFQVGLDCGTQSLAMLVSDCVLTGSGWSETVGELGFSGVIFNPSTGMLSGSVSSYFGDISVNNITLPLRPSWFQETLDGVSTHHALDLSIANRIIYGDGVWELKLEPQKALFPQTVISTTLGIFDNVDFSLADVYTLTLTDPDGSETKANITINPGSFSLTLTSGTHFISSFCTSYPASCPDGASLKGAEFSKEGDNLVADGTEFYEYFLRPRDQYGNTISTGSVSIQYTATITTNQLDDDGTTIGPVIYMPNLPGSAVISDGGIMTNYLDGTLRAIDIPLVGQDITYKIRSFAPTNATNIVKLESVAYKNPGGTVTELTGIDKTPLAFRPWFQATMTTDIAEIQVGEVHGFEVNVLNNSSRVDVTPDIFSFLSIGDNAFGAWRDFTANETINCQAYPQELTLYAGLCEWSMVNGYVTPSVVHIQSADSFVLTGSYAPMSRYPIKEDVVSKNIISYDGEDTFGLPTPIIYNADVTTYGTSVYRDSRLKILGVNNALGEYGDLSLEGKGKAKFFDNIRKNITLLARNRTTFDDINYDVIEGNSKTLTGGSFDTKRAIFVLGGDVTITNNILPKDAPVVLVSLADSDGNGGIVAIDPSVTDLDLTIITNRHVTTSGDMQLYIHGSIISSNTLGDTLAGICPKYITATCDTTEAAKYDLEKLREGYTLLDDRTGKSAINTRALSYPSTAIIIEHDNRIISSPPPGL